MTPRTRGVKAAVVGEVNLKLFARSYDLARNFRNVYDGSPPHVFTGRF